MRAIAFPLVMFLTLTGCATQSDVASGDAPGFLLGLFHGFTSMFSLIGSLFTEYRVYAYPNSGFWYDFGFCLGVILLLGGGGAGAKSAKGSKSNNQESVAAHP